MNKIQQVVLSLGLASSVGCGGAEAEKNSGTVSEDLQSTQTVAADIQANRTFYAEHTEERIDLTRASGTRGGYVMVEKVCGLQIEPDACAQRRETGSYQVSAWWMFGWTYYMILTPDDRALPAASYEVRYEAYGTDDALLPKPLPTLFKRQAFVPRELLVR
jgi:hypothetical protein